MTKARPRMPDRTETPPAQPDSGLKLTDDEIREAYLRWRDGWTVRDLAERAGVSKALLHAYIRGARAMDPKAARA